MNRSLVIVNGAPASGKTTLAAPLAQEFRLPLIQKDAIKETLFDALGTGDVDWSRRLSEASFEMMFTLARGPGSKILEGNFRPDQKDRLLDLGASPIEIFCHCSPEELVRRFEGRAQERHPGHHPLTREELVERAQYGPLDLGGPMLRVDTENPNAHDLAARWLREL
jgi:predicted kinase